MNWWALWGVLAAVLVGIGVILAKHRKRRSAAVAVLMEVGVMLANRKGRFQSSRDQRPKTVGMGRVLAALGIGLFAVVGFIVGVTWLTKDPNVDLRDALDSDIIRSVGFAAAAVVAVPLGYITYRRQLVLEQQHQLADTKDYRDRFESAVTQLGSDNLMARMAGVYAIANLADDWGLADLGQRQMCIDVLCAYLRTAHDPGADNLVTETAQEIQSTDPGLPGQTKKDIVKRASLRNDLDVRRTIVRVIRDHLLPAAERSWQGHDFDFTGATFFDGTSFSMAEFQGGRVLFTGAKFPSGKISFTGTKFDSQVSFDAAEFVGGVVQFIGAKFLGSGMGKVSFDGAEFDGAQVLFNEAKFFDGWVSFSKARFTGGWTSFDGAKFDGGHVRFTGSEFIGGHVSFNKVKVITGQVSFTDAQFAGGVVSFGSAQFTGGHVSFNSADFTGGKVSFHNANFAADPVLFASAKFAGGNVEFVGVSFTDGRVSFDNVKFTGGRMSFENAKVTNGLVTFLQVEFVEEQIPMWLTEFASNQNVVVSLSESPT